MKEVLPWPVVQSKPVKMVRIFAVKLCKDSS